MKFVVDVISVCQKLAGLFALVIPCVVVHLIFPTRLGNYVVFSVIFVVVAFFVLLMLQETVGIPEWALRLFSNQLQPVSPEHLVSLLTAPAKAAAKKAMDSSFVKAALAHESAGAKEGTITNRMAMLTVALILVGVFLVVMLGRPERGVWK